MSDYLNIYGKPGKFQLHHEAYRRTGEKCRKKGCKGIIKRKVINGRSAHFCRKGPRPGGSRLAILDILYPQTVRHGRLAVKFPLDRSSLGTKVAVRQMGQENIGRQDSAI